MWFIIKLGEHIQVLIILLYADLGLITKTSEFSAGTVFACSEEINTVATAFIRAGASQFNYSTNPSFSDKNDNIRFGDFINNPVTYITTIGLYNDNGDCLAVAKLPFPHKKDFHTDLIFKVEFKF